MTYVPPYLCQSSAQTLRPRLSRPPTFPGPAAAPTSYLAEVWKENSYEGTETQLEELPSHGRSSFLSRPLTKFAPVMRAARTWLRHSGLLIECKYGTALPSLVSHFNRRWSVAHQGDLTLIFDLAEKLHHYAQRISASAFSLTKTHCLLDPKIKLSAAGESTPGILVQPVPLVETVPGAQYLLMGKQRRATQRFEIPTRFSLVDALVRGAGPSSRSQYPQVPICPKLFEQCQSPAQSQGFQAPVPSDCSPVQPSSLLRYHGCCRV